MGSHLYVGDGHKYRFFGRASGPGILLLRDSGIGRIHHLDEAIRLRGSPNRVDESDGLAIHCGQRGRNGYGQKTFR